MAAGGVPPYTFTLATNSDMPPGLFLSAGGVLSGTPNAPGNFRVLLSVTDAASSSLFVQYNMTVDNALGQAPALSLAPKPINVYYVQGSPAPAPLSINVATTSGNLPFNAMVTGIPGVTISTANGTTSSISNLTFNVGLLPLGTSTGVMAVRSTESANQFDALPVTVTVTAPPPCTYAVNPTATSMPSSGGPGSFAVAAGPPCSWVTTASAPSLLQITGGASGMGVGNVGYTVAPNTSPNARTLFVNVAGQQHAITQFGTACSFALSPSRLAAPASGGLATITITPSDAACAWTASSASGLGLAPTSGTGTDRVVQVTVPVNPDAAARVLTATIGLRTLRIDQAGAACTVGLSPYAASAAAAGVQGTVAITTLTGCDYETTSAPSWVSITSGGSANVSGNLVYSVAPNSTTVQRIGTLTIGGQAFQITQDGLPCSVTVNTSGLGSPYGPAGGVGLIGITANGPNCSWTASSNAAWAAVNPLGGTGSGSVGVTIQSNASSVSARNTLLTIAGQSIGLSQDGTSCNYRLQSANGSAPASGGAGSVGVVAPNVCTWASTSNDPSWLTIVSAGSGGTANVQFFAQANTSASPRVGSLTIAGLPYTVTQAGAPCAYTFSPTTTTVASTGATGSFPFSTTFAACTPVAQSYSGWIAVNTSFNGAAGAVDFTVQPNPTTFTRTGTIRLGDQDYTVQQTGGACGYSLNAYSALFGPLGATDASVLGSPTALGCVPDVGTDQPSFITIGGLIGPVGNIFTLPYSIAPFPSITPATRRGRVTFGGQIHSVKQTSY